ncbi:PTS sugar transporter subunit IIA [Fusibacter ferrireducens]|uniref:PTS glucose transporter subunit IIA n=1 Tax=Fusibacter ferrireducens TaxID=2785058 RepID=A0ABR9ZR86_9FIRM|nr:PTS glucose transporter subunit IIA [Fusibacter ferrireducens]MBF4692962.1 PTS glucose transporter subunit IIA [Fusibacter ferrireducens]
MFGFNKRTCIHFLPVAKGKTIRLEEVPDAVFSQKMLGDGYAVIPSEGVISAPVSGTIVQVFPTLHAIGIETKEGLEVLVHIGLNTVTLKGEGFSQLCEVGKKIKAGDPLVRVDLALLKEKNISEITPVLITNMEKVKSVKIFEGEHVKISAEVNLVK